MADNNRQEVNVTIQGPAQGAAEPGNGVAVAGLVLGILACVTAMIPVIGAFGGIVMALIAIPLSAVGINKAKKVNKGKGAAITGLVLGIVAILLVIMWGTLFVAGVNEAAEELEKTSTETETELENL